MSGGGPNRDARERAEHVEAVLDAVEEDAGACPVNSDDLAARYRGAEVDVANGTESLADAFDRFADQYDEFADSAETRAALTAELRRDERFDEAFTDEPE